MSVKLYAFPLSPRSFKVLWAAEQLGVDYEFKFVDFSKNAQKAPEYLAINPNGRAPALEHDGFALWESNAILEYLASLKPQSGAMPADARAAQGVRKWLYWESAHWDPACAIFVFERVVKPLFGLGEMNEAEIARGAQMFERLVPVLDDQLKRHRYVAGEALTVADLAIGSVLCVSEQAHLPIENYRNILRWQADVRSLPSWQKASALRSPPV